MAANRQTDRHTHACAQAVTLVWGSLRLAPINSGVEITFTLKELTFKYPFYIFVTLVLAAELASSQDIHISNASLPNTAESLLPFPPK